jgi:hypothetical protein
MRSASAPDGTSRSTIAAAQTALSNANASTVIPKSRNITMNTG